MNEKLRLDVAYAQQPFPGKNEDRILVKDAVGLYGVLDGVSSREGGGLAATTARDYIASHARSGMILGTYLYGAHKQLCEAWPTGDLPKNAGTTALLAQIDRVDAIMRYAQAGDSFLLLYRDEELRDIAHREQVWGRTHNSLDASYPEYFTVYEQGELLLREGDRIVIGTDGVDGGPSNVDVWEEGLYGCMEQITALNCASSLIDMCYQTPYAEVKDPYWVPDDKSVIVIDVYEIDV